MFRLLGRNLVNPTTNSRKEVQLNVSVNAFVHAYSGEYNVAQTFSLCIISIHKYQLIMGESLNSYGKQFYILNTPYFP